MLHQDTDKNLRDPNVKDTPTLIASDRVEGTRVYGADGKHIGSIERLIIGKKDGRVAYAVLSFGGFLGIGHDHYPLPWEKLSYDTQLDGYRIDLTKEQIEGAPVSLACSIYELTLVGRVFQCGSLRWVTREQG